MCNIFAEDGAFTVMMRLTDAQYEAVYGELKKYTRTGNQEKVSCFFASKTGPDFAPG
jgi:hypothetical protein